MPLIFFAPIRPKYQFSPLPRSPFQNARPIKIKLALVKSLQILLGAKPKNFRLIGPCLPMETGAPQLMTSQAWENASFPIDLKFSGFALSSIQSDLRPRANLILIGRAFWNGLHHIVQYPGTMENSYKLYNLST